MTPLYSTAPAPIGLGEFGLNDNNGSVTPYILNTTSVQATFDPTTQGPNATDLADSSPDGYGVQLNAVVTNVTLFGNDTYQFWTQNVIEYYPYSGQMYLITNVWNFSSPASYLSSNVFYQHGPFGTQVGNEYYYAFLGPFSDLYYPFNVTFTMTSNITDGRNAVFFSLVISQGGSPVLNATNYDYVIFNSLAPGGTPLTQPANYTADGYHYNPLGLTNDFEITIGGPGGGSQTTFLTANAVETLNYWDATTNSYQAVPSAFSYGGETGETSVGAGISWATGANGQPYGIMSTGASLLGGLWNASSPAGGPGWLTLNITPSNAFVILNYTGSSSTAFNETGFEWAATVTTSTLLLPGGQYMATVELSDYQWQMIPVTITPGEWSSLNVALAWNGSYGVYTPIWAWENSQLAGISTSGNGTQWSPYQIINNEYGPIAPFYGVLNDYLFPVFPGVYLLGTTAYVDFNAPASLEVDTYVPIIPANHLPFWFYGDSNVAITNATGISGWFSHYAYDYPYFLTFNVEFWNCTGTLIYNDVFATQAQGLLLYNGYSSTNPVAAGDAVIWGNTFVQLPQLSGYWTPYSFGLGLDVQENFDLIYNNGFFTPTTAVSYPTDFYYGYFAPYFDWWNIPVQNASNVNFDSNWPQFPMSGSYTGTSWQGGNFWWDYGLTESPYSFIAALGGPAIPNSNPYNVLPYTESGWIYQFGPGDNYPLLYTPLQSVTIAETGLPAGTSWNFVVAAVGYPSAIYWEGYTTSTADFTLPNGTYQLTASAPGYSGTFETFNVSGTTTVTVTFLPNTDVVTFAASGLPAGAQWVVQFNGVIGTSTSPWINFTIPSGVYAFSVTALAPGWVATPSSGTLTVTGNTTEWIAFAPYVATFSVYFTVSGVASGTPWVLDFNGTLYFADTVTVEISGLTAGSYPWNVSAPTGYNATPSSGTVTLTDQSLSLGITFTLFTWTVSFVETGLTSGTQWAVGLGGVVLGSTSNTITFQVAPGTYGFWIGYISGWSADPSSGSITVNGPMTINITFSP